MGAWSLDRRSFADIQAAYYSTVRQLVAAPPSGLDSVVAEEGQAMEGM